jgi:hypothetical protein
VLPVLLSLFVLLFPLSVPRVLASGHTALSPRMALFERAAARSGVPLPVLIGLAWEQSFLSDHGGRPSIDEGYGLMDLSVQPGHDTLAAAARLLHVAPARLRRDDALNVLGGALLLAQEERALTHGRLPTAIGDWAGAVVRFAGMRSEFTAHLLVDDLYRALRRGIVARGVTLAPLATAIPNVAQLPLLKELSNKATETSGPPDYPGASWEPANYNNYTDDRRPYSHPIRYIVIHDTEGSCAATVNWFQNSAAQASAHYIVCRDGRVIQMVHERDIAYHAGNWPINEESIGIEHEGYEDHNYYTRAQYTASAALVSYLCAKYGMDPDRNVIFGHENVPAADHTDPGPYWNWSFYMQQIRGDRGYDTGMSHVAIITGNATIHTCPQASCSVLGTANWGEQFYKKGEQNSWDEIYYNGQTGWVWSGITASGSGFEVSPSRQVSVWAAADPKAPVVGAIPAGQVYISLLRDNGFWYIYYNHRYGFIPAWATQTINCQGANLRTPDCALELDLWAASLNPLHALLTAAG